MEIQFNKTFVKTSNKLYYQINEIIIHYNVLEFISIYSLFLT